MTHSVKAMTFIENSKISRDASEYIANRDILFTVLYLNYSHLLERGGSKNGFFILSHDEFMP